MADIERWSETRSDEPVDLGDFASKNVRVLNPLATADLYFELYDKSAEEVVINDPATGENTHYKLVENINHPDSGFHAKVIQEVGSGHHVLLAKGLDLPGKDEGDGGTGFAQDLSQVGKSGSGCISDQVIAGEEAYLSLIQNPDVSSVEIVGYSMGSIPANYLASVYGAETTNIADLGVPGTGSPHRTVVAEIFNLCGNGMFPGAHGDFKTNLENGVIRLDLSADILGAGLGRVGSEFGEKIDLDAAILPAVTGMGIGHVPGIYGLAAKQGHDAPETTTTKTLEVDNWKPFN